VDKERLAGVSTLVGLRIQTKHEWTAGHSGRTLHQKKEQGKTSYPGFRGTASEMEKQIIEQVGALRQHQPGTLIGIARNPQATAYVLSDV
jgi:hypothetical protein